MVCTRAKGCQNPAEPGRKSCEYHLDLARQFHKRQRARCAEHGPAAECSYCRKIARQREIDLYLARMCEGFGMTVEDYWQMNAEQGGLCAICQRACSTGRRLAIDHCHAEGRVRGLLCLRCNVTLGLMDDDVDRLAAAIRYLERS